jgi:hypothetical protein
MDAEFCDKLRAPIPFSFPNPSSAGCFPPRPLPILLWRTRGVYIEFCLMNILPRTARQKCRVSLRARRSGQESASIGRGEREGSQTCDMTMKDSLLINEIPDFGVY